MQLKPIDELLFKGTHNSYDSRRRVPPPEQIQNFGVWAVELDYSIPNEDPKPRRAVVGHDGPGAAADGEDVIGGDPNADSPTERFRLQFFLQAIRELQTTGALRYRPVIIYFEKKQWTTLIPGFPFPTIGRLDDPNFDEPARFLPLLDAELRSAFGDEVFGSVRLATYLSQHGGRYPTIPELAGKVIPIAISAPGFVGGTDLVFHDGPSAPPGRSINLVGSIATECDGLDRIPSLIPTSHVIRVDNHQADGSFKFGVPPNPLVVQRSAPTQTRVQGCDDDVDVHPQGTFLFPYGGLTDAVSRALGIVPPDEIVQNPSQEDPRRTGFGWTLLIKPGLYQETIRISIPLTLKMDDRFVGEGPVVIGKLLGFPI
jgi:hypothetical protein